MILAFGNKGRQGKDTAGEAVVNYYNERYQWAKKHEMLTAHTYPQAKLFKFADALYRVCRDEYGMKDKDARLLQQVGDGRREQYGHDYWINKLAEQINRFKGVAVITDVRYTNEADWVKAQGGFVINVTRLNLDGTQFITNDRDPNFISEVQLDNYNWDFFIKSREGDAALTQEMAITIAEYARALTT